MSEHEITDQDIQEQVGSEIEQAKDFAKTVSFDEIQNGEWFTKLLRSVIESYKANVRAEYFQQKYPGLAPDEIADKLISVTTRYAAITGGITGLTTSVAEFTALASAGMTIPVFLGSIGVEMIYLARLQLHLVLDLSIVYDLQLDLSDPEDVLMIFAYSLGIGPNEIGGKILQTAVGAGTKNLIKTYISRGTLQTIQKLARQLGFKILQRTIIQYAVPVVSIAVSSSFNYITTNTLGQIAKSHFKNRGQVTEELRQLISRQYAYDLVFPISVKYIAQVDGEFHEREQTLYKAMISRMSFDDHKKEEFLDLLKHEDDLLEQIAKIEDKPMAETLLELLIMMAIYDGKLVDAERDFLLKVANTLKLSINIAEIETRAESYRIDYSNSQWRKVAETASQTFSATTNAGLELIRFSTDAVKSQLNKLFSKPSIVDNSATE
jgi:tellurite resistance protein